MKPGLLIAGKYRLKKPLGDGAMGLVWSAINERTDREVALKLLVSSNPDMRRRLLREAKACGRLSHKCIVEIYDVGETDDGEPFLVMQLLKGETLQGFLKREGKLPTKLAAGIALDVARALSVAHDAGVVHRDLKPANIFLHRDGDVEGAQVKVLDFGVSKVAVENESSSSVSGSLIGSPAYMSPEQAKTESIDGRADLWSLGVVLYEMLAGERPFKSAGMVNVLSEILLSPIPRVDSVLPTVDKRLADVVARCLERDLDKRVQSAAELTSLLAPFSPRERYSMAGSYGLATGGESAHTLTKEIEDAAYSVDEFAPTSVFQRNDLHGAENRAAHDAPTRKGPDSAFPTVKRSPAALPAAALPTRKDAPAAPSARADLETAPAPKDATTSTSPVSSAPVRAVAEAASPILAPRPRSPQRRVGAALAGLVTVLALIAFGLEIYNGVRAGTAPAPVHSASVEASAATASAPLPPPVEPTAPEAASAAPTAEPIASADAPPATSASAKRLYGKVPGKAAPTAEPKFKLLFPMPGDPRK